LSNAVSESRTGGIDDISVPIMKMHGAVVVAVNAAFRMFTKTDAAWPGDGMSAGSLFFHEDGRIWTPWDTGGRNVAPSRTSWNRVSLRLDRSGFVPVIARYFPDSVNPGGAPDGQSACIYLLPLDEMPLPGKPAEEPNEELNLALAHISHEFRTPLNAILGFSEIMGMELMGGLKTVYRDYALDIHYSAEHLKRIVEQMLDIAKLARGQMALEESLVSFGEVVHRSIGLLQAAASARGIELHVTSITDFPAIYGDEGRLRQVFLNVLGNAVKFSDEGGRVQIDHVENAGQMTIWVRDQGGGMTDTEIERATQSFSRARAAVRSNKEGTGLGLPISRWILEAHQGALRIESRKGVGTSVGLQLPASRVVFAVDRSPTDKAAGHVGLRLSDLAKSGGSDK
jgi:signal transduction histidine kinase